MLTRRQVLGFRGRAQQLDRDSGTIDDTAVLDLGVQDTGTDGARWALTLRGVEHPSADDLATVWTPRGAPPAHPTARPPPRPPPPPPPRRPAGDRRGDRAVLRCGRGQADLRRRQAPEGGGDP